jgi:hypothetical protein
MNQQGTDYPEMRDENPRIASRRDFLKFAGISSAAFLLPSFLTSCTEDPVSVTESAMIDVRKDAGLMNFAYLSTQFQYEFYRYVTYAPYIGARTLEVVNPVTGVFARIQAHLLAQKNVFRNTHLENRIPDTIAFQFPDVNFTSRTSVFAYSQMIEDMATQAFCTLLSMCRESSTLTFLSKIASVKARHSAVVRDLADINAGYSDTPERLSFASDSLIPSATGLEPMLSLRDYLDVIQRCTTTRLTLAGA